MSESPKNGKHQPKWIAWEVTRRCNLQCVHCRSSSDEDFAVQPFSTAAGEGLLDQLAAFGDPVVVLTGGEPLLRPDVFELARYGTAAGLRMCMATNGLLVTDETCAQMKDSGIRMVSLSLDGATAETHDAFRRQPGAFDATMRAAARFREHGISFLFNSSFTRRNRDEIPAIHQLVRGLGATAWYLFLVVPTGRGEELMAELIQGEEYDEVLNWHYDAERAEPDLLMRPTCAPHYYRIWHERSREEGRGADRRSLLFSTGGGKGCIAGQTIALIDFCGNVKPCSYLDHSAGNVFETPFADIWEKAPLLRSLRDRKQYKGRCGQCEYWNVCGGCRVRAEAVHGDVLAEEPFCNHVPLRMRRAGADPTPAPDHDATGDDDA